MMQQRIVNGKRSRQVRARPHRPAVAAVAAVSPLENRRLMAAIAVFNFNAASATGTGASNEALLFTPSYSVGGSNPTLTTNFPVTNVVSFGGTAVGAYAPPGGTADAAGVAIALQNGTGNANNGDYLQEALSTAGYSNINVSFAIQKSSTSTSFSSVQLQYATDGATFTNFGAAINPPATFASTGGLVTFDLSAVPGLNNDANAALRLVFSGGSGTTSSTSNNRLDNLILSGTVGTGPGTPVLTGLSVAPNPVAVGSTVTFTATGAAETNGAGVITGVTFYQETNGVAGFQSTDTQVASGSAAATAGTYSGTVSTTGLAGGTYTYYAVAADSNGTLSAAQSTPLTVSAGVVAAFSAATFNAAETDNTATITVTLASPAPSAATVTYAVTTGTRPADATAQQPDVAVAGRDFTARTGTLQFAAGATSATFTVPLTNVATFAGTRNATLTLTGATGGAVLGTSTTATLAIADNQYAAANPTQSGVATYTAELTTAAPKSTPANANNFAALTPSSTNGFGTGTNVGPNAPFLEFGPTSAVTTSSPLTGRVDSLKLSLYNTAATGAAGTFNGIPGSFDVYLLSADSDAAGATPAYKYLGPDGSTVTGADGNTGPTVVGPQGTPLLVGSAFFPDAAVGYNDYTFDGLSSNVSATLANLVNNKLPIRFIITPSQGAPTSADWQGNGTSGNKPLLTLLSETSTATAVTFSTDQATVTVNKGATAAITLDRSGDVSDTATVNYTTANGTATAGTDYTAASGTATFAAGQSQTTVNVPIAATAVAGGDRTFTLSISGPAVGNTAAHIAVLGTQQSTTVTIHDQRTTTVSTVAGADATVQPAGPRTGTNGTNFLNVEGTGAGVNASFGVIDFNDGLNGSSFPTGTTISTLNGLTLSLGNAPFSGVTAAGPFDVYLVENTATSIADTNTTLQFSTTANATEGLATQLGTKHLLGSFTFSATQSSTALTGFALTAPDAATTALIASALGNGTPVRLALTPESSTVAATFAGLQGLVPTLSVNYTAASATQLPFYLDPASQATYNPTTNTVTATGTTTFVADPGAGIAPTVVAAAAAAKVTANTVVGSQLHLAGLSLTNGATFTLGNAVARPTVLDVAGTFAIDATSKLDLGVGDLDLANGNRDAIRALVARGYANGTWTGTGITSSAAANDVTRRTAVGLLLNNADGSTALRTSFDGNPAPAATDVLVKYTYYGDANLDGSVNGADYTRADAGYAAAATSMPLTGWYNGDFNFDGKVDGSDYTLIDNAFNTQKSTLAFAPQAVAVPVAAPAAEVVAAVTAKAAAAAPVFSTGAPITAAAAFAAAAGDKMESLAGQVLDLTAGSAA